MILKAHPITACIFRKKIISNLLAKQVHDLTDADVAEIISKTEGYSGSDMDGLVREAAIGIVFFFNALIYI